MSYTATKEKPFFVHDHSGNGFTFFATEQERDEYARECIEEYLDDGWGEDVVFVTAGVMTHSAQKCDVIERPPADEIGEDGIDSEGRWWDSDWSEMCNYKMLPL